MARLLLACACLLSWSAPARADRRAEAQALMARGQERLDAGDFDGAAQAYEMARRLEPQASGPLLGLGLARARASRCDEAVPVLEAYLAMKGRAARREGRAALESCRRLQAGPPAPAPAPVPAPARVRIVSEPPGAEVHVDDPSGPLLGTTPLDWPSPRDGRHRLFLSRPGFYTEIVDVEVAPGEAASVQAALRPLPPPEPESSSRPLQPFVQLETGRLVLEIAPSEAQVTLAGVRVARKTRRYEAALAPGTYQALIEGPGLRAGLADVRVEAGKTTTRTVTLKRLRSHGWLGLAIPATLVAVGAGAGAIGTFYTAESLPPGPDFETYKTANAALQGVAYGALAISAVGYLVYALTNRGRVGDGPPLRLP